MSTRRDLCFPIMVCRWDERFYMFQADYTECGLYFAVKGSVLSFQESEVEDTDALRPDGVRDVFPINLCRPPKGSEITVYNRKKTV